MAKAIFLVAGYSGVGKSTVINNCLEKRIPLFGELTLPTFLSFKSQENDANWMVPIQDLIRDMQCLPGIYLEKITQPYPENLLVHLDLLTIQITLQGWPSQLTMDDIKKYYPRNFKDLKNYHINLEIFKKFLSAKIFKDYQFIHVNTITAPYEVICDRWVKRSNGRPTVNGRKNFFEKNQEGLNIFNMIHRAWFDALKCIELESNFITDIPDSKIKIKKLKN